MYQYDKFTQATGLESIAGRHMRKATGLYQAASLAYSQRHNIAKAGMAAAGAQQRRLGRNHSSSSNATKVCLLFLNEREKIQLQRVIRKSKS